MTSLHEILNKMAREIEGVIAIGVFGMDGMQIAEHNPSNAPTESFAARFAMIMKLVDRTASDIQEMGELEENLVQTSSGWFQTSFIGNDHYIGIAVSREATLGQVRLIANRYKPLLSEALG